jgi:transcriptional regulator with XRE-family HTH domain
MDYVQTITMPDDWMRVHITICVQSKAIRKERRIMGLRRVDVAQKASVRQALVSDLENGVTTAKLDISIAGLQEKTAFLKIDEQWQLPPGPTPTSHIFKPAMKEGPAGAEISDTPWNEWLCLVLCRALGLQSATDEVLKFDG